MFPLPSAAVTDWDAAEGLMDYSFRKWLRVDTREHPWMVCEPTFNPVDK